MSVIDWIALAILVLGGAVWGMRQYYAQIPLSGFLFFLAIGSLQMMLDRGELKDWFGSAEIWVEATVAALCLYLFIVHTATAGERSFLNRALLRDANCVGGTLLMFLIGVPLYGTMTLLPTMKMRSTSTR